MLTRIYGTAFFSKSDLNEHLERIEEAKARDHRKLGPELGLFVLRDEAPGMPFWMAEGTVLLDLIETEVRAQLDKRGYVRIDTPQILDEQLWHRSGHYDNYRENMFFAEPSERDRDEHAKRFAVRPMNCPGACLVFDSQRHSYRELPLRMAEFGRVSRFEREGVLHGLLRVRAFTQDDAHVYCTPEQTPAEVIDIVEAIDELYEQVRIHRRPRRAFDPAGEVDRDRRTVGRGGADAGLRARGASAAPTQLNPGDGAFYGPKIDFHVTDALGRSWQLGTCQLDFFMPERFELSYQGADNAEHRPLMIHRALLGSMERFAGILIEHHGGRFPDWLAPTQVVLLPVADRHVEAARATAALLREGSVRVRVDERSESVGKKIRDAELSKAPYMVVLGDREAASGELAVRSHDDGELGTLKPTELISRINP